MIPLKLTLKNFLSYGDDGQALDFTGFSIACLSGKNGHGKSALIDAMTWALWGKCRVKTNEEVIKRGATEARVELEFESEGTRYRIIRSLAKKKGRPLTSFDLQVFDAEAGSFVPVEQGAKAKATIEEILKMDYNAFICSSFILQGMADEFTRRTPAERKDVLSKILDLDEYEALAKTARDRAQEAGYKIDALKTESDKLDEEIARKETCEAGLAGLKEAEGKVLLELSEFESMHGSLIREHESLNAGLEALKKLSDEKRQADERLAVLLNESARLGGLIRKDREIVSREEEILTAFREFERLSAEEKELGEKQVRNISLQGEYVSIQNQITNEKTAIEHRIKMIEARIEESEKVIGSAGEILAREAIIESGHKKLGELAAALSALDEKRQEAEKLTLEEASIREKINHRKLEMELLVKDLTAKSRDLAAKSSLAGAIEKEVKSLRADIAEHEAKAESARGLKEELKHLGEDIKALQTRKADIEKRKTEEEKKLNVLNADADKAHCPLCESPLGAEATAALAEKLTAAIAGFARELAGIGNSTATLRARADKLAAEIRNADSSAALVPGLNKELGEKESALKESLSKAGELETNESLRRELESKIRNGEYRAEFETALAGIEARKSALGYDARKHEDIKKEFEGLRGFETEFRLLANEKTRKSEAESQIEIAKSGLAPLVEKLSAGSYAEEHKARLLAVKEEMDGVSYDEERHAGVKRALGEKEGARKEKEALNEARLNLTHRENEEAKLAARIAEEKRDIAAMNDQIAALSGAEARLKEVKSNMELSAERLTSLREQKDDLLMEISRSVSALERIAALETRKKELAQNTGEAARGVKVFQELAKAFGKNGLQALIIEHAVPEIEIEANRILGRLTEGGMSLSLEMLKPTQKGGERETLEIYIGDSSGTRSYETFSGGEAFRIDFALRVAISKFIANRSGAQLRTLVIDEGFGTQDKDGLDHFVQVINSIKGDFDMILAITHVDELKERFPVRIEVTKEPGRGSGFEVVHN